jgi:hypothetical protein
MPWRNPSHVPFTRISIVASVPCESGVFAIYEGTDCLLLGNSWNLRGRFLELTNGLDLLEDLTATFELCPEWECEARLEELSIDCPQGKLATSFATALPALR